MTIEQLLEDLDADKLSADARHRLVEELSEQIDELDELDEFVVAAHALHEQAHGGQP